jgi:hypothetical protein
MASRLLLLPALLLLIGCRRGEDPSPAASASASAPPPPPPSAPWAAARPTGPRFAILAGKGVGPIRKGATVATLERHMQAKCEQLTPKACSYFRHGIEFQLDENAVMTRLHIHRPGRRAGSTEAGADVQWGAFNGAIPPDLVFGMLPKAVQEHLGPPKKAAPADGKAFDGTVEQHFYEGMVLEYERMPSGALVLAGIRIPE